MFLSEIEKITEIKKLVKDHAHEIVILLVINTKGGNSVLHDYEDFSVTTEYFSESELNEITRGFEGIGCKVDFSNGEKEFTERVLKGDFRKYDHLNRIVYNSTGSGTGKCRTAFVPALCSLFHLKNCSNDIYSSVIPENKVHFFNLLSFYGFPIPQTWYYDPVEGWLTGEPARGMKLITKPAYECASIGISGDSVSEFSPGYFDHIRGLALSMNQPVLVQEFISGYEVEVPVFDIGMPFTPMSVGINMNGNKASGNAFLTYDKVYDDKYSFFSFCRHDPGTGGRLKEIAQKSFAKLGLQGMMRVDYRVNDKGQGFIMDYNNSPHLTEFHSCAFAIKDLGFEYPDMLSLLLYKFILKKKGEREE